MKRIRFTEEQIIAVLREHDPYIFGSGTCYSACKFGSDAILMMKDQDGPNLKIHINGTACNGPIAFLSVLIALAPCASTRIGESFQRD